MGQFWTKKKEDIDEKTVATEDFMQRMTKTKRSPEETVELPKIEMPKE